MLLGRESDLVHRGGGDDRVAALHAGLGRLAVGEVAADEPAAELVQPCRLLRAADEAGDLIAARAQQAHDVAADESRSPGYEDLHGS